MEFNVYLCDEEFGLSILSAARYNYNLACAVKRLLIAAQYPDEYERYMKEAQDYVDAENRRRSQSDPDGLARWEAQQ